MTRKPDYDPKDLEEIRDLMEDKAIIKVFHNCKFDVHMIEKLKIKVKGRWEDTSFVARICNNLEDDFKLKNLAWRLFDYPKDDMDQLKEWVKKLRSKAQKKGWNIGENIESDYWLCQHVDELMPELSAVDREEIRASVGVYCVGDTFRTMLLWNHFQEELEDEHFRGTYESELKLLRGAVMAMERRGMAISKKRVKEMRKFCRNNAKKHLKILREMAAKKGNHDFNPNSPQQLAKILYSDRPKGFGLESIIQTKSGQDSTNWKALRPYQEHPFVRELLMFRSMDKAVNMFFDVYRDMMRPDDISIRNSINNYGFEADDSEVYDVQVLHPSLNQCGTVTGRFSCNDPNLQQVANPESSPRGTDIQARYPFIPRPGYTLYMSDYAQMELRAFADIANVPGMLDTIARGEDLNNHNTNTAWGGKDNPAALEAAAHALELGHDAPTRDEIQAVWDELGWSKKKAAYGMRSHDALLLADEWLAGFDYDIVNAEKSILKSQSRQRGKTVMFVKMYGGGAEAVTDLLFCTVEEAKRFMKQFDRRFPEIVEYIDALSSYAAKKGYIINRYGRKLQVDPRFSYRAVNYMIQSTCADLMKDGIRKCHSFFKREGIDAHVLMTVHDELICEIRNGDDRKAVLREIIRCMEDHEGRLGVPMKVEMKKARDNWSQKENVSL